MTIVTTSEAQSRLPSLLASVAQGEEVLITDGGLPVARLSRPDSRASAAPDPAEANAPESGREEDDERPWRGVFAIEGPGNPYPGGIRLSAEPLTPSPAPADILWERINPADE